MSTLYSITVGENLKHWLGSVERIQDFDDLKLSTLKKPLTIGNILNIKNEKFHIKIMNIRIKIMNKFIGTSIFHMNLKILI